MGAPVLASGEEVAQPEGSSQLASAPSSADAMVGVGIQVRRTRYFFSSSRLMGCSCGNGLVRVGL